MLSDGIIPLADFVKFFYQDFSLRDQGKDIDDTINDFLKEHPTFYVNLLTSLSETCIAVVFEGPADEVKELRKEL